MLLSLKLFYQKRGSCLACIFALSLLPTSAMAQLKVWIFRTPLTGAMNQRIAVAERLSPDYRVLDLPSGDSTEIPIDPTLFMRTQLGTEYPNPEAWPDVILNTEVRKNEIDLMIDIRRLSPGKKIILVYLENPKLRSPEFDLVVNGLQLPDIAGENIFRPLGVATRITDERLQTLKSELGLRYKWLRSPLISVALGGDSHNQPYPSEAAADLGKKLVAVARASNASVIATNSRRTTQASTDAFLSQMSGVPFYFFDWHKDLESENPYPTSLALADYLVVSGDSLSMMSDAVNTGKPLYIHAPAGSILSEHQRMIEELYVNGIARPFTGTELKHWTYEPLNVAEQIANKIREMQSCESSLQILRNEAPNRQ